MAKVIVGFSGGVDSSVAAYLVKQQGHEVEALYMQNWDDTTGLKDGECQWEEDYNYAKMIAKQLNIPLEKLNYSEQYRDRIVNYMFDEYKAGRTPNPDVLCNREVKWDLFLNEALKRGADYVATGHYCRKNVKNIDGDKRYSLLKGLDVNKDQSYFLCQLNQFQLSKALFPIGDLNKSQVRELALKLDLASANKKDSQGLCFIGKVDLPTFLQQKLISKSGDIIEISKEKAVELTIDIDQNDFKQVALPINLKKEYGTVIGKHNGAQFYTIGQRRGLGVGGKVEPLFIVQIDVQNNIIYVGEGKKHALLNRKGLFIKENEIHYLDNSNSLKIGETKEYDVKIRYRQKSQKAKLIKTAEGLFIYFDELQSGIAPGQFAVWYKGDELIGSGVIS